MYVNALITLQENLSTYGIEGKRVTGHVIITSPGLIKCYVQNLKKQASGQTYALYAFSKTKDNGIRLGNLGSDKETKWIIDGKNIENSGMNLEELDAIAIVVEDDMRGADTILMGFKNNRYMIIPLIDEIFKKRVKSVRPGGHGSPSVKPEKSTAPSQKAGYTENTLTKSGKLPPKPVEPGNPLSKPAKSEYSPPRNEKKIGAIVNPDPVSEGIGPVIIPQPGIQNQGGLGPDIILQTEMQNQGEAEVTSCPIEKEVSQSFKVKNQDTIPEKQDFIKVKILDKKVNEKTQGGRIESIDLDLLNIAEKLKQIGRHSSEGQNVKPDTPIAYNNISEASKVREDAKDGQDEVSKELQRIINMLKENQEIKQKTKGIEEQIERMRKLPQTHKFTQKSDLEKTLESRYMAQQLTGVETEDELEEESYDTSPKNALNFMLLEKQENLVEKIVDEQDEIDYIHEIDKKIREIEERRRQQKDNK